MATSITDTRRVVDLLIEQVEFANVIVINKADLISELELRNLKSLLSSLNPAAHVLSTTFGEVPLKAILNTGLFDFNRASQAPGWLQELRGTHKPETLEFGISSFVFEAKKPFHSAKLQEALKNGKLEHVVRSKGFVWLANSPKHQWIWSHAGTVFRFEKGGTWHHEHEHNHKHHGHEDCERVDKKQLLVMIGVNMNHTVVKRVLEQCLCEEEADTKDLFGGDQHIITVGVTKSYTTESIRWILGGEDISCDTSHL
jgi:G3E family GTPase